MRAKAFYVKKEKRAPFSLLIFFTLLILIFAFFSLSLSAPGPARNVFAAYLIAFFGALFAVSTGLFIRSLESRKDWLQTLALEKAQKIRKKSREIIVLDHAIRWIATAPELGPLTQKIPELFAKITSATYVSLILVNPRQKTVSVDHYPAAEDPSRETHLRMAEQYLKKSGIKFRDLPAQAPQQREPPEENMLDRPSGPWIVLPLQSHDQTSGLVVLSRSHGQSVFSKADFRRATILATQLSETLQSIFYLRQVKAKADLYKQTCHMLVAAQNEIVEIKRLATIGRLLSNATHDLVNPLGTLIGYTELASRDFPSLAIRGYLREALREARRCQRIVQDLLMFARRKMPDRLPVDLPHVIEDALASISLTLQKRDIRIEKNWGPDLPKPQADPHQLTQVFINILMNACQALEDISGERRIQIDLRAVAFGIEICISNNGPSIAQENLERIFEPFFTTRGHSSGTGLGLNICTNIIKNHGGKITARNDGNAGAAFVITLPLGKDQTGDVLPPKSITKAVLVIDDEIEICNMVKEILEEDGLLVDIVCDGESALERLEAHYYDLIICDYIIPKMNGRAVYEHLKEIRPHQASRFSFMTGSTMGTEMQDYFEINRVPYLLKPISANDLLALTRILVNK